MSRVLFTISFLISVAFHGWLLTLPPRPVEGPRAAVVIPIVETELARVEPPEIPQLPTSRTTWRRLAKRLQRNWVFRMSSRIVMRQDLVCEV